MTDPSRTPEYVERHLVQAVADHPQLGELEVDFSVDQDTISLSGKVSSESHHRTLVRLVGEMYPGHEIRDGIESVPAEPRGDEPERAP